MKKLLLLTGLLLASPAFAVDNTVVVTPGTGVTMRSKDIGAGVESMVNIVGDASGNPIYGTAGTANANILTVQGIASMTPLLATVTGSVNATLGATQNTNLANIDSQTSRLTSSATNIVAGSALATTSFVVGSRYLSTPPTFTNGQEGALQISSAGRLLSDSNATQAGTWNITNVSGTVSLPTGAATSANQTTANSSLATIATNTAAAIPAGTAIIGKVGIDQTTDGTTNAVHLVAGTALAGKFGIDQTTPGTTNGVQLPTATNGGAATVKGGVGVVNGGSTYQAVAASQTATVLQTSTGAAGDYLSHCVIYPTSTSPGVVTVFDNTNTAATSAILFAGGATSTSNLTPISVPVGAVSTAGAWKVTTGAAVSVVCFGKFS